jgi:hypothetical protein
MRKHPLVTLSACGFLTIGGVAATLESSSATSGAIHKSPSTSPTKYRHPSARALLGDVHTYRLDGFSYDRRPRHARHHQSSQAVHPANDEFMRRVAAAERRRELLHRAALAKRHRVHVHAHAVHHSHIVVSPPAPAPLPAPAPVEQPAPAPAPTTTVPAPAPKPAPAPAPAPAPTTTSSGVWYELRMCESNDDYSIDTGNGYYGAYQFSLATWYGLGFSGLPSAASPAVQDQAAQMLEERSGWGQWPACSAELGL